MFTGSGLTFTELALKHELQLLGVLHHALMLTPDSPPPAQSGVAFIIAPPGVGRLSNAWRNCKP